MPGPNPDPEPEPFPMDPSTLAYEGNFKLKILVDSLEPHTGRKKVELWFYDGTTPPQAPLQSWNAAESDNFDLSDIIASLVRENVYAKLQEFCPD